ncbi:hypothetical protein ZHAS_00001445 [Anopheles sinensis]|uniref:Ionotropic glutamate receptor L-glutamate and glycine-binding domain-containing protein n=1 Tax=Anopheles sinensis TaxID=74873 RepID=A0A084VBC7_ANOSI|nr:hypothetical protein ZHAS_00001445 [Anopheles sinensis]
MRTRSLPEIAIGGERDFFPLVDNRFFFASHRESSDSDDHRGTTFRVRSAEAVMGPHGTVFPQTVAEALARTKLTDKFSVKDHPPWNIEQRHRRRDGGTGFGRQIINFSSSRWLIIVTGGVQQSTGKEGRFRLWLLLGEEYAVVNLLDRILLEARTISIETYSFVGTNESFFRNIVDRLAWRCEKLMVPIFNNVVGKRAQSRQLVIIGGDNFDSIMGSIVKAFGRQTIRYFGTNSRNIYVILILSDLRFVESKKLYLLKVYFSTLNFIAVSPPPTQYQPLILMANGYHDRVELLPPEAPMSSLFADRFQHQDVPPVNVLASGSTGRLRQNTQGDVVGPDWNVFRTILEHLGLRWNLTVQYYTPSLEVNKWVNDQLERGTVQIYIDRGFLPTDRSVVHYLPEMNGFCMVLPKAKKYQVLRHLLRPLEPMCWIVLGVALFVGSLLTNRYCKHSLLATLLFGTQLNTPDVSRTERMLLFSSLVLFFIISEAYQAKLLSLMSSQRYPPDPRTVADFLRTDTMLELGETTATVVSIRKEFAGCVINRTEYDFSFDGRPEHGVLMPCPSAWVHLLEWTRNQYTRYGRNIRPPVHIVSEKLLSTVASYSFSGSFKLYPRFRGYLDRLFESGLVTHWQTETGDQQQYERQFEYLDSTIISFSDLTAIWSVLAIGYALATVTFLIEVFVGVLVRVICNWMAWSRAQYTTKKNQVRRIQ